MEFLLDTHTLIWSQLDPSLLSKRTRKIIEDPYNDIFFSPINMWEIATKYSVKKNFMSGLTPIAFLDAIEKTGEFEYLEFLPGSAASSYELPMYHRDPFDRMLVWEALQHDYILLSSDSELDAYKSEGLRLIN